MRDPLPASCCAPSLLTQPWTLTFSGPCFIISSQGSCVFDFSLFIGSLCLVYQDCPKLKQILSNTPCLGPLPCFIFSLLNVFKACITLHPYSLAFIRLRLLFHCQISSAFLFTTFRGHTICLVFLLIRFQPCCCFPLPPHSELSFSLFFRCAISFHESLSLCTF